MTAAAAKVIQPDTAMLQKLYGTASADVAQNWKGCFISEMSQIRSGSIICKYHQINSPPPHVQRPTQSPVNPDFSTVKYSHSLTISTLLSDV